MAEIQNRDIQNGAWYVGADYIIDGSPVGGNGNVLLTNQLDHGEDGRYGRRQGFGSGQSMWNKLASAVRRIFGRTSKPQPVRSAAFMAHPRLKQCRACKHLWIGVGGPSAYCPKCHDLDGFDFVNQPAKSERQLADQAYDDSL